MTDVAHETIYLAQYTAPAFWVDNVELTFKLNPTATRVTSKITFRRNSDSTDTSFFLHGEDLKLIWATIDGTPVQPDITAKGLTCDVPDHFVWQAEVEISPETNTSLNGLYMSNGMFCTQCEAEGFRKITFYPDRPDVMAPFKTRVEGDFDTLLSNGNPTQHGSGWAEWDDPWPKPAYLFALVAGDLIATSGSFTTMSGKNVDLNIYVRPGDEDKCDFGMAALKRSMKWDEDVYQREYDLDIFNIVAVDDFNMGAMENKGLNIFNSSCVLANPQTATDANFERIEAIIAHEYFHNWTGNRITCRDWFQLCLKEGLTVFRDQQFSADVRSAAVRRVADVQTLRARQFREDAGPLAHPVRPESFVEINNFYTATVYEKGAEIIRMLRLLVGAEAYDTALQLYFDRHDGQACTIEDWLQVFTESTGHDLAQFKLWYAQAGTPQITVEDDFSDGTYTLTLAQHTAPTPGQDQKMPLVIPVELGLLSPNGQEITPSHTVVLNTDKQSFTYSGFTEKPIASLFRGFSAPVTVERDISDADLLTLMAHDTDPFNRWESGRTLQKSALMAHITNQTPFQDRILNAMIDTAAAPDLDPAFRVLCLSLPTEDDLAQALFTDGHLVDPDAIRDSRLALQNALAQAGGPLWNDLYNTHQNNGPFSTDAAACADRAMVNAALAMISKTDNGVLAQKQFDTATNMTAQIAALAQLVKLDTAKTPLQVFYDQWRHEPLVIDKWFGLQAQQTAPAAAIGVVRRLMSHPDFTLKNPNRFRALIGSFAGNAAAFHSADGAGYDLVSDQLIELDALNPQLAARMSTVFETWRRYDTHRQTHMKSALTKLANHANLSRDTAEMVGRLLG